MGLIHVFRCTYRFPGTLAIHGTAHWLVQEHQVDIVQFGQRQALIDLCFGAIIADIEDFGGEEDLVSGNSRCADGVSAAFFIAVHRRGINLDLSQHGRSASAKRSVHTWR